MNPEKYLEEAMRRVTPQKHAEYCAQLEDMLAKGRQWRLDHPAHTLVVAPISQAVKHGFVRCNADGLELLKALHSWDLPTEPTVMMVKGVLEELFK